VQKWEYASVALMNHDTGQVIDGEALYILEKTFLGPDGEKVIMTGGKIAILNELGDQGWELTHSEARTAWGISCAASSTKAYTTDRVYYFKRPKSS
jgi:hypothetical protein